MSPRERMLAQGLENRLLAIQGSWDVNEELSRWKKAVINMNKKEIKRISKEIASKVEKYASDFEKRNGRQPRPNAVITMIDNELEKLWVRL